MIERRFCDLASGDWYVHHLDYVNWERGKGQFTTSNVYRKLTARKYEPLSGRFVGTHRYPSINVVLCPDVVRDALLNPKRS